MNILKCEDCGKHLVRWGARWCKVHGYRHRKRPSGLKYNVKVVNKGWTKKGERPLSYDVLRTWWKDENNLRAISEKRKGIRQSPETEFKLGSTTGDKNIKWEGDDVGYYALHTWVRRHKLLTNKCEWCGSNININLANLDFEYTRDLDTWAELCVKCHKKYDSQNGWGLATKKFSLGGKR